jgi:hypothetical protein
MSSIDAQLQAMGQLQENWDGYGAAAPQAHIIDLARAFVGLMEEVLSKRGGANDPLKVCPTRIGGILIEWDDSALEHEVEINPDQSFSFLHLNKATGNVECHKFSPGPQTVIHPGLLQELRQMLAAA